MVLPKICDIDPEPLNLMVTLSDPQPKDFENLYEIVDTLFAAQLNPWHISAQLEHPSSGVLEPVVREFYDRVQHGDSSVVMQPRAGYEMPFQFVTRALYSLYIARGAKTKEELQKKLAVQLSMEDMQTLIGALPLERETLKRYGLG